MPMWYKKIPKILTKRSPSESSNKRMTLLLRRRRTRKKTTISLVARPSIMLGSAQPPSGSRPRILQTQ